MSMSLKERAVCRIIDRLETRVKDCIAKQVYGSDGDAFKMHQLIS